MSSTRRRLQLQLQQQQQNNRNAFGKLTYLSSSRGGEEELPFLTILVNERFYYFRTENEFGTQAQNPLDTQQWVVGETDQVRRRETNEMSKDHNENAVMLIFVYFTTNLCVEPRSL